MPDSACLSRPVRSTAIVLLASFLSLLLLPAAWSAEIDSSKPKPPKPTGFPVVPGVYRLNAGAPGFPTDDLEPLRKIIGGAGVVGLGESIHTSGGYLTMKDRVFRFLVEKMGFRVLALENNWGATDQVEQFVQTCQGSADDALIAAFSPLWRSTEMRDLALWMCAWNRSHKPKDRVHLYGFDIQQPEQDGTGLLAFLARIGIGPDHAWTAAVRACDGVESFNTQPVADSVYAPCVEALDAIRRHFDQNTRQITRQTSAGDLAWARVRLTSLLGWQGFAHFPNTSPENFASRDAAMALVLRSIRDLRYRNARTVVWTHNSHAWKNPHPTAGFAPMMGSKLREAFGRGYVSLGLVGSTVEINAPPCARETPPVDGSVEKKLESLGTGGFLLADLINLAKPPFFEPGQSYVLALSSVEPRTYFDGLIWLEHSDPMIPLDRATCP